MRAASGICSAAVLLAQAEALVPPPAQIPLHGSDSIWSVSQPSAHIDKRRPLHGRFLHITDFHPDPFYEVYSSTSEEGACHRGQGPAGIYGAETSECDSPVALVNKTIEYIAKELKDKIDFVVWTGDSARHDNDEDLPRNKDQVLELNQFMVHKMADAFGKHNGDEEDDDPNNDFVIPIVPNFGNNDILPHNIFTKGPNQWTRTYAALWRQFIPEVQQHSFQQGGWFYVEVIPNKLAVFSLNTLYFFTSNSAADGCAVHGEPGYQQLEWLRIQLRFMRNRGVKAILMGHVPPVRQEAKTSWDETCWQKYTLWLRQYRDVVISGIYGHFNYDHFMFQDFKQLDKDTKHGRMQYYHAERESDHDITTQDKTAYFIQLRDEWAELPEPPKTKSLSWLNKALGKGKGKGKKDKEKQKEKKYLRKMGGKYAERYSATFVSASVVPNLFPTLRIFEYNTTGLGHARSAQDGIHAPAPFDHNEVNPANTRKKKKGPKKYKFTVPDPPSKSAPPGPAYSPQTLSLIKYTQYFANLTHINNDFLGSAEEEDDDDDEEQGANIGVQKWHEGKHKGKKPHDRDQTPNPRKFKFEKLYDTQDDDVYHLQDLTMPNLIDLARRIGKFVPEDDEEEIFPELQIDEDMDEAGKHKKHKKGKKRKHHRKENEAWYAFVRRAFVETLTPEQIDEEFGQ